MLKFMRLIIGVACSCASVPASASIIFTFNNSANVPAPAVAALTVAGQRWSSLLVDNIHVNIGIDFTALAGTAIAGSTYPSITENYPDFRNAMIVHATSADDALAVAHLPNVTNLTFLTNDPNTGNVILDRNGSFNNGYIKMPRANARALGFFSATSTLSDGSIRFNNALAFDYDQSDGIDSDKLDFVGIAEHEIGHILGFDSGVDTVDIDSKPNGPSVGLSFESIPFFPLDLFRYSAASTPLGIMDFSYGGTKYFSLDAGNTNLALFSTGTYNGDGQQPSHWKDNLGLGIMDPTWWYGPSNVMSSLDVRAMDVIGYTSVVPEPGIVSLLIFVPIAMRRKNMKRKT